MKRPSTSYASLLLPPFDECFWHFLRISACSPPRRTPRISGDITRDYLVLSHGWFPETAAPRVVCGQVNWRSRSGEPGPSKCGGRGKPSRSYVKGLALGSLERHGKTAEFSMVKESSWGGGIDVESDCLFLVG